MTPQIYYVAPLLLSLCPKFDGAWYKYCKQAGLYRVQLSVFLGKLEATRKDTLHLQIEELINADRDKVYLFPMTKQELQQTVLLGQAFDRKLVTDQVKALFL